MHNSKLPCFLFYFLVLSVPDLLAHNSVLNGQVKAIDGEIPVVNAIINLSNGEKTITDTKGYFRFEKLEEKNYLLHVTAFGFEKYEQEILIKDSKDLNIIITLSAIKLNEVTVSSGKSINKTEAISNAGGQLRPVNSSQDLLRLVPGLFIAQHAGGGKAEQIFLRGFDCDHGTDFYISVDGMPVNMVSHAHGQGYADFHFVIPETIDRLNVYKGPYTTRFGDFSTAGTGEFFTRNSIDRNEVKAEYGIFDSYRLSGVFNLLDKKHFLSNNKESAYAACEYVYTNSYFDNKQKFGRLNLFGKYSAMWSRKNYFTFSASAFKAQWDASGQIPQRAVEYGIVSRFGSIDSSEGGKTNRTNLNAVLTTETANGAVIKNQIYYVNYNFNLFSDFTFFLEDPLHGDEINQTDRRNIFGYNGTLEKDYAIGNKTLHAVGGLGSRNDYSDISLRHAEKRVLLNTIVAGKLKQQNTNAFADATVEINNHLSINAGTRVDYFRFFFKSTSIDSLSGTKSIVRASPKLNFMYSVNDRIQFFLKSGIGFHSNDARSVIRNNADNSLPQAFGYEIGGEFNLSGKTQLNIALWGIDMQSQLLYVGDEGTVETNNPTRRLGVDIGIRSELLKHLFTDIDLNYSYARLLEVPNGQNYIPLAPSITSAGGVTYKKEKGLSAGLRYRYMSDRPANESNTITARGYFLLDALINLRIDKLQIGCSAENILNVEWNQAQFDTRSRLKGEEAQGIDELHFTPGNPFFLKAIITYSF